MTASLLRFVADTPFGEPMDETVIVELWPFHGFEKSFTLLGVPGVLRVTFDPPLVPDELFGEVMQGMVDSAWLRERAETVAASGDPFSNEKAAALFEAADAAAALGSPEAAP